MRTWTMRVGMVATEGSEVMEIVEDLDGQRDVAHVAEEECEA